MGVRGTLTQRAGSKQRYAINLSETNGLKYGFRYPVKAECSSYIELKDFSKVFNPQDFRIITMDSEFVYLIVEYVKDCCDIPVFKVYSGNEQAYNGYAIYDIVNKIKYGPFEVGSSRKFSTIEEAMDDFIASDKYWKNLKMIEQVMFVVLNNQDLLNRCNKPILEHDVRAVKTRDVVEPFDWIDNHLF